MSPGADSGPIRAPPRSTRRGLLAQSARALAARLCGDFAHLRLSLRLLRRPIDGRSRAQMWGSPNADVGESRQRMRKSLRRCAHSPRDYPPADSIVSVPQAGRILKRVSYCQPSRPTFKSENRTLRGSHGANLRPIRSPSNQLASPSLADRGLWHEPSDGYRQRFASTMRMMRPSICGAFPSTAF